MKCIFYIDVCCIIFVICNLFYKLKLTIKVLIDTLYFTVCVYFFSIQLLLTQSLPLKWLLTLLLCLTSGLLSPPF